MKTEDDLKAILSHLNLPFTIAPLQFYDVMQAYHDGRFALFYDVGGGKTLVATLVAMMHGDSAWGVMPHILIPQWQRWLKRARVPDDQVYVYYGHKRDIQKARAARWVLTSHAIFRKDIKTIMSSVGKVRKTLLLDEAQIIKDPSTKIYAAVRDFVGADGNAVLMTATPTNKPQDTYSYMKIKTPSLYRTMTHWESLHVAERDFFGQISKYANMELLRDNFAMQAAKRDKKELFGMDMVPRIVPVPYELSTKHSALYRKLVDEQLLELPDGEKIDATSAQRLRHAMQQIIWNPEAFSGDPKMTAAGFDWLDMECGSLPFMNVNESKYVLWTYYRSTTERIFEWMKSKFGNTGCVAYGGSNSSKAVDSIMFDDKIRWMVANPLSVGAGLELQHVCDQMGFPEMPTSPIPVRQAIGRVDRPGQDTVPTIRIPQALGTIQISMFEDLLRNDETAVYIERTRSSLRAELLGQRG